MLHERHLRTYISLMLEARRHERRSSLVPDVLYHVTSTANVPSIMQHGILPKPDRDDADEKYEGLRVFLAADPEAVWEFWLYLGHSGKPALFQVNTLVLPADVNFYDDEAMGPGFFWTPSMIMPKALQLIKK